MTAGAAHGDGGVNILAFGLVFMALDALRRVGILVERNRMGGGAEPTRACDQNQTQDQPYCLHRNLHPKQSVMSTSRTAVICVALD
jgi:hypothetical protein